MEELTPSTKEVLQGRYIRFPQQEGSRQGAVWRTSLGVNSVNITTIDNVMYCGKFEGLNLLLSFY
jgi:hypothetical protein